MKDPLKYVRSNILSLLPYSTARDEYPGGEIQIWLDANESPYSNGVNRYPDPHHKQLKKAIARIKGVSEGMVFIGGSGSDEAIDLTYRIFCSPGFHKAIVMPPTYGVYGIAAQINDVEIVEIPLEDNFSLPIEKILSEIRNDSLIRLIWICSPNNPTGNAFSKEDILRIADNFDGVVAVDEAYVDFSDKGSILSELASHPNIIVLQTFSKAWGMASLRCGMAFSVPQIAAIYNNVKYPYNMNGPTQEWILERLEDSPACRIKEIIRERDIMSEALKSVHCVKRVYDSDSNFLLVEFENPDGVYFYLIRHGIIVRNRSKVKGCGPALRITIGTPEENCRLLEILKGYEDDKET